MDNYQGALGKLNPEQKRAATTIDGPLLVIAGPGTGKTQLLAVRIATILTKTDTDPANILCLTFTEAAAQNMRDRLFGLIGDSAAHVGIYTFHSFGSDIIRRYPEYFLDSPLLHPIDELGSIEQLQQTFDKLPHGNPFSRKVGENYLHLRSAAAAVSWIKQAGFTPGTLGKLCQQLSDFVQFCEPLVAPIFAKPPASKLLPDYQKLLVNLADYKDASNPMARLCISELAEALQAVSTTDRHVKSVTAWRNRWLIQTRHKVWVCADRKRLTYLQAIVDIYAKYQQALASAGQYDYDDMILRSSEALVGNEEFRLTLQEQYQYILVDEYQDTSGAQERLLQQLADNPLNEERPNLMVVGDDDQAIYRFQGAYLSIMQDFLSRWRDVQQIVVNQNYRSAEAILQLARRVILKGVGRLEYQHPELNKQLRAAARPLPRATVKHLQARSEIEHYQFVAAEVARLIRGGTKASDIAILAPRHSYLENIMPYLLHAGVPVSYERRENILQQPRIAELITLLRWLHAAGHGDWQRAHALMPRVLAAAYWQLPAHTLTKLSLRAFETHQSWLELLLGDTDPSTGQLGAGLAALAEQSLTQPFEITLDQLLGNQTVPIANKAGWLVPFRGFYFSDKSLKQQPAAYLALITQLTTLRTHLHEYRPGSVAGLDDFIDFVDAYTRYDMTLLDTSPHSTATEAVQVMTVHKAKGLEWGTVFLLGANNNIWGSKVRSRSYSFNLPIALEWIKPARDSLDDRLRLFYVAMTRAKSRLYFMGFTQSLQGKPTEPVIWLQDETVPPITQLAPLSVPALIAAEQAHWQTGLITPSGELQSLLKPALERYALSPTHLNDFLNVITRGPQDFFFRHILHFPEVIHPAAAYGSAVHRTLQFAHSHFTKTKNLPPSKQLLNFLTEQLATYPLPDRDRQRLTDQAKLEIPQFMKLHARRFRVEDLSEYDFAHEGVRLANNTRLTGKIDVIRPVGHELTIIDYKTGVPFHSWEGGSTAWQRLKAHQYKQQLEFYALLVSGSAHFGQRFVARQAQVVFVSPDQEGELTTLDYQIEAPQLSRLKQLIKAVWQHIMTLQFPDVSNYSDDQKGTAAFEQDMIDGKI